MPAAAPELHAEARISAKTHFSRLKTTLKPGKLIIEEAVADKPKESVVCELKNQTHKDPLKAGMCRTESLKGDQPKEDR